MELVKEQIRVKGKTILVDAVRFDDMTVTISGRLPKVARVKDEWYGAKVDDPQSLVDRLRGRCSANILTFVQRLPATQLKYHYHCESVSLAVIPVSTFSNWWEHQISKDVRKNLRRAEKRGVICRLVDFDDNFVRGVTEIYNECPVRQGKPFWHYGKPFETVKIEASTYLDKSAFIGAYIDKELIGFIKLLYLDGCASTMHVISKIAHRDKSPTNALIAKAVELCEEKQIRLLNYGEWIVGSLGDFKRYSGFQKMDVPRYYVPLDIPGRLLMQLKLHRGVSSIIPQTAKRHFVALRRSWHEKRHDDGIRSA